MPETFQYKVRDKAGKIVAGSLEADNELLVLQRLREMGYTPLEIGKEKQGLNVEINIRKAKVKLKDVAVFSRQFATMINSGPVDPAGAGDPRRADREQAARRDAARSAAWTSSRASSLSGALAKHPKVFNDLYVSMVKSGETGGSLDTALLRLADTLEKQVELRRKVKSAMTYPVVVVGLVVLIMTRDAAVRRPAVQEDLRGARAARCRCRRGS